jgi:membrane protein
VGRSDTSSPTPKAGSSLQRLETRIAERFPRLWRAVGRPAADLVESVREDEVGVEAGSMTYGAVLSLPPILLLTVAAADVFLSGRPDATQRLVAVAEAALPGLGQAVDKGLRLSTESVVGAGLFGVVSLMWAASGYAVRARHALGAIFRTELLGLVTGRLGAALVGIPVLLVLLTYAAAISWVASRDVSGPFSVVFDVLGFAALMVGGGFVWTIVYLWTTPERGPSLRDHVAGGFAFAIAFLALERFGAAYVDHVIARSRALYGAIGALFGLFAFLYVAMWLFLFGAELTKLLMRPAEEPEGPANRGR